ncbi:MAG: serine/threonine protein kinase [Planctomycetes bacterium]|nr:serine/threonine protein kinase [Planctomycetota bacterium]
MPSAPHKKIGPYTVEGVLGKGCMGVVYKVRHPKLGSYALKVLRTELGSERDLKRFKREIELLAAMSEHPNVVKIHTAAEDRGRIYYVMDLIEGEDLQAKLKHGPLQPKQAARYVQEVASAVDQLHQKGIVHRDIKPANVIVDDRDRARLSDFGLARSFTDEQSRLTRSGEFVGTPLFMAPEQATGAGAGPEADVYALGMVLYTLLAGRPAIQGESTAEVLQKLRAGAHRPLRKLVPDVSPVLADLVMRTLSMDPRTRPRDAGQLARELGRFVEEREAETTGAEEKRKLVLALVLALVVVVGVTAAAVVVLRGGGPAAPSADADAVDGADEVLDAARAGVLSPEPPDPALFEQLEQARAPLAAEQDPSAARLAKLGELWALEGELRLRTEDYPRARACLEQAEKIADPKGQSPLRNLARRGLAALRAGLGAYDPRPEDELVSLIQALQAAELVYPDRLELFDWRVAIAVRFERWEDAQSTLERHPVPDRVPAATRARIYLAADDLPRAETLLAEVDEPALLGELRYRQGVEALNREEWAAARDYFADALAHAPAGPQRGEATRVARELYAEASEWRGSTRRSRLAKLVQREVAVARALKVLDPGFELPRRRFDVIFRSMPEVGHELEAKTLGVLDDLLALRPEDLTLYKLYGEVAQEWFFPNPERQLEVLRRGFALAEHARDQEQLAKSLGAGLYFTRQLDPLLELERGLPEGVSDSRRCFLLARAGDLLRWQGKLEPAADLLARAAKLDSNSHEVALFSYWLEKVKLARADSPETREAAIQSAWRFLELYPGFGWHENVPELCGWLAKVEAARGKVELAVKALERMREYRPDQVQWDAYRLELLAGQDPWPEGFQAEVDKLRPALEHAIEYVTDSAQAGEGDRREVLRRRIDALRKVSVTHLEQAAATGDRETLLRGLQNLQQTLRPLLEDLL